LEAALEAGAGAVYFGLTTLNARRAARNFRQDELADAVRTIHAHGARAYLTLNIDLAQRELGQAARVLELARQRGADAVLVRDPALLALRPEYPDLEFHFSTQTCMTNSADAAAAGRLGADRVVLARELSLAEIAAASAQGVRTEVFVQGALCFSVSGRCLLSSWVGGRSGNRGTCTSPCRVPWTVGSEPAGTPLSMHDLATADRLEDLRRAGVTGLKIEGRLKSPDWVRQAVTLYREAMERATQRVPCGRPQRVYPSEGDSPLSPAEKEAGEKPRDCVAGFALSPSEIAAGGEGDLRARAAQLGAYAGRAMTSDYLDGRRDHLTGESGREGSAGDTLIPGCEGLAGDTLTPGSGTTRSVVVAGASPEGRGEEGTYDFSIQVQPKGIVCRFDSCGRVVEWTVPKTVVRRAHKAMPVGHVLDLLGAGPIRGFDLREASTNDPEFLMVPRAVNALMDRVGAAIHQAGKAPADRVRIELPDAVQAILEPAEPHAANRRPLGEPPDRARLDAQAVGAFLRKVRPEAVIVEGLAAATLDRLLGAAGKVPIVAALAAVFFEDDLPRVRGLLAACKAARVPVEVNSWGGWRLACQAGVRMEGGPGLAVLNGLAAKVLYQNGIRSVTWSPEADRRQFEELSVHCPAPASLVVFGRPPLVTTRVRLPESSLGQIFEDRRGVRLAAAVEQGLAVFRPIEPFDLRDLRNERIRACHLVVDLVRSEDPAGDWHDVPQGGRRPFRFNYDRSLA
jgi:collagenase-like PrtC family protease